jgi:ribosomal protein S18 acetylase RimI-like enzyme
VRIQTAKACCEFFVMYTAKVSRELPFVARFLDRHAKYGYLRHIEVKPEHRGKGVGTAVLKRTIREMQRRGCEAVLLIVDAHGDVSRLVRWYRRLGFRVIGRSPGYATGNPFDVLFGALTGSRPSETFMGMRLIDKKEKAA